MATCEVCEQEMTNPCSCIHPLVKHNNRWYGRRRADQHCTDCNCPENGVHHFGCDQERCPICNGQFAFCDCYGDNVELGTNQIEEED